jgi:hypothetical protein
MYVAVKGGERAIDAAHDWLAEERRGDQRLPALSLSQIIEQLSLTVARVMAEGSLYDQELAALAIKQSRGDLIEAIFLIRAYRTTLPRFGYSNPIDTGKMSCMRRISATFKDAPGGQILGPTFDYTHRLLDFTLAAEGDEKITGDEYDTLKVHHDIHEQSKDIPHIMEFLNQDGLIQTEVESNSTPDDLTREPLELPASRSLQRNVVMPVTTLLLVNCALGIVTSKWKFQSLVFRLILAKFRSRNAKPSTSLKAQKKNRRNSHAAMVWSLVNLNVKRFPWRWLIAPCAGKNLVKTLLAHQRKMRNLCFIIAIISRRQASSSTSSFRIMSISNLNSN